MTALTANPVNRAKALITRPSDEWPVIATDPATPADLMRLHTSAPRPRLPEPHGVHQPLLDRLLAIEPEHRFRSAAEVCATITV